MAKILLSWVEVILIGLGLILLGFLWMGVGLVLVALFGNYFKMGMQNRWFVGTLGAFFVIISLMLPRLSLMLPGLL